MGPVLMCILALLSMVCFSLAIIGWIAAENGRLRDENKKLKERKP